MRRSSRGRLDDEDQLETVDLVFLRPNLREAERSDNGERRLVVGRHGRVNVFLAAPKCPPDQRARGFLGVALAAMRGENAVPDLGTADHFRRPVESAVADERVVMGAFHQSDHPRSPGWRAFHTVQLDSEEAIELVLSRKLFGQRHADQRFGVLAIAVEQRADGIGLEGDELETRRPDGAYARGG
jgi:hypothetical protein